MRTPLVVSLLCVAGTSVATPLANPDTRFRAGANHHVGDDSFVARFGRAPDGHDREKLRMKTHLAHVRDWLAARPATRPELARRRAELIGYLDDYIAKGITPANEHLPWRSPVFIDDGGAICAVGYLIERSVDRALPEKIAREHRFEYLEDIAAAMPEVRAWVAGSGFTLEELASIQPAYSSPNVETWRTWDLANHAPPDGPFETKLTGWAEARKLRGAFQRKALHGEWTVALEESGAVIGRGTLDRGNGRWTSFYSDGKRKLAEGSYRNSRAHGAWTFFHPSGNVAAKGWIDRGMRTGVWSFYYDTPAKTPIAKGRFAASGSVTGVWQHFDPQGKLLARTYRQGGEVIDITADATGVTERVHAFEDPSDPVQSIAHRLERYAFRGEKVFVQHSGFARHPVWFDADGFRLDKTTAGWTAADCHWPQRRKAIAASDNVPWLHKILHTESHKRSAVKREYSVELVVEKGPTCGAARPVPAARAAKLDAIHASKEGVRAPTPEFLRLIVTGQELDGQLEEPAPDPDADGDPDPAGDDGDDEQASALFLSRDADRARERKDLRDLLATRTIAYVEWPHIDGRFHRVFRTLAGHYSWEWHSSEPEADGSDPLQNAYAGGR